MSVDDRPEVLALLATLKTRLDALETLRDRADSGEDEVYRFYHHSFKVFRLQDVTTQIVAALQALAPDRTLNATFLQIVAEGTGKTFLREHNARWLEVTRPIVEAFFHAHYFLTMAIRYGHEFDEPPQTLPSGWAAFLYLYNLR